MTPKMQRHFENMYVPKVHPFKLNRSYFDGMANPMNLTADRTWDHIYKTKMKGDYNREMRKVKADRQSELDKRRVKEDVEDD